MLRINVYKQFAQEVEEVMFTKIGIRLTKQYPLARIYDRNCPWLNIGGLLLVAQPAIFHLSQI